MRAANPLSCRVWVVVGGGLVARLMVLARMIMGRMVQHGMGRLSCTVRRTSGRGVAAVPRRGNNFRFPEGQFLAWTVVWDAHRGVCPPRMLKHVALGQTDGAARAEVSYSR